MEAWRAFVVVLMLGLGSRVVLFVFEELGWGERLDGFLVPFEEAERDE